MTRLNRVRRRAQAARMFACGCSRSAVAQRLGVSRSTASRWFRLWVDEGAASLCRWRRQGRRSRLDASDQAALHQDLASPPRVHGFDQDRWTLAAIACHVEKTTGHRYHRRHIGKLLRRLGWTVPPVGRFASHALRRVEAEDPEGNALSLFGRPTFD